MGFTLLALFDLNERVMLTDWKNCPNVLRLTDSGQCYEISKKNVLVSVGADHRVRILKIRL